jgi:site-specific DNA-adenine methylase
MLELNQRELDEFQLLSGAGNESNLTDIIDQLYPDISAITDASREEFIAQFLPYIGGKYRQAKFIQANLPTQHFNSYVSVFGGMMWDFLRLDPQKHNIQHVIYNDVNQLNVNLFRCVIGQRYEEFFKIIKHIPNNDQERFYTYQQEIYSPDLILDSTPNFDIAMKYAYVLTNVFSGLTPATAKFVKNKSGFDTLKRKLDINNTKYNNLRKNFDRISEVVNLDFAHAINYYDSCDTFLFVDRHILERKTITQTQRLIIMITVGCTIH